MSGVVRRVVVVVVVLDLESSAAVALDGGWGRNEISWVSRLSLRWVSWRVDPGCCLCHRLANMVNGRLLWKRVFVRGIVASRIELEEGSSGGNESFTAGWRARSPPGDCLNSDGAEGASVWSHRPGSKDFESPCRIDSPVVEEAEVPGLAVLGQGIPSTAALRTLSSREGESPDGAEALRRADRKAPSPSHDARDAEASTTAESEIFSTLFRVLADFVFLAELAASRTASSTRCCRGWLISRQYYTRQQYAAHSDKRRAG